MLITKHFCLTLSDVLESLFQHWKTQDQRS